MVEPIVFEVNEAELLIDHRGGIVAVGSYATFRARSFVAVTRCWRSIHVVVTGTPPLVFSFKTDDERDVAYLRLVAVLRRSASRAPNPANTALSTRLTGIDTSLRSLAARHGDRNDGSVGTL